MSTFGGTTDLIGYEENVRYVPTADMVMHAANIPLVSAPYGLEIKACRRKIRSPARMFQISRLTSEQWKSTLVVIFGLGGMTLKRKRKQRLLEHQNTLHAYAMAISGEPETAADLVQDCAVRVLRSARVPADNKAFKVWLFAIIRNLWIDNFRKKKVRNEVSIDDLCETALPVQADMVIVNALAVRLAFEELSAHHKDVLALVDVAGFSYAEAAGILDVAHGTVMSRVSRARCALASMLEQENVVEIFARKR